MSPILSILCVIFVLGIILKLIALPFKIIFRIIINSIVGLFILMVLNMLGLGIAITGMVVFLVGVFGIPGVIIAVILSIFF